jgi:two-component system, OmpR family, sensor histidine kinase TctE
VPGSAALAASNFPVRRGLGSSLRRHLLVWILLPVSALLAVNAVWLYTAALDAANSAYDRTLLASAKSIGELLEVTAGPGQPQIKATLSYAALEAFEADNRSRIFYKVIGFSGEMASGFAALPAPRAAPANPSAAQHRYAALVHFYDDHMDGEPVRMAVLLQPVSGLAGHGMAIVQVAETLELRRSLARELLVQTLWQQALLIAVIAAVVLLVVQRATDSVRALSQTLQERAENDLSPLQAGPAPRELQPMIAATNGLMARLSKLLDHQKRFVRDASHQLRTPLAVLKTQVQSAQRGDMDAQVALEEIGATVARATELANQMLAMAKVEQMRQDPTPTPQIPVHDWTEVMRAVALDLAPLVVQAQLDFELLPPPKNQPLGIQAHAWALRELSRNLLHNAIKHGPPHSRLTARFDAPTELRQARLTITDSGPGLSALQQEHLFQPFAASGKHGGSGLGLAICFEIVQALGGTLQLTNRTDPNADSASPPTGLNAVVTLPLHPPIKDNAP